MKLEENEEKEWEKSTMIPFPKWIFHFRQVLLPSISFIEATSKPENKKGKKVMNEKIVNEQ